MMTDRKHVRIYTDGGCDPNPGGPGGYAAILTYQGKTREVSGGFRATTNNRMELYAVIAGLEALTQVCRVTLYSDSKYIVDAMQQGWATRWKANNWWRTRNERATNIDLWERILALCETHDVAFEWVKGHAGNPYNERCDQLAMEVLRQPDLPIDEGYTRRTEESTAAESATDTTHAVAGDSKMTFEGQPCRKCGTPVVKRAPRAKKRKTRQTYYYEYYLHCPQCGTNYMVEAAKRTAGSNPDTLL